MVHKHVAETLDGHALQQQADLIREFIEFTEPVKSVIPHADLPGNFSLQWSLPVSVDCCIIIPTRDQPSLLARCLESVWKTTQDERNSNVNLQL